MIVRCIPLLATLLLGACPAAVHAAETKTLDECLSIALAQQPILKAANATVDAAKQRVYQAASNYLPQLNGNYAANRRNASVSARTGTAVGTASQTFNFYSTGMTFTQVLFDFGQTLNNIQAAQASAESADADMNTQRETVVFNVKQAYFGLLAAIRLVAVADESVRQSRQHLTLAESRHEVGLAPRFDVTREQVQLASNELNQLTATNAEAVGRETLRNAMGLNGPMDFDVTDPGEVAVLDVDEPAALAQAYLNRPEIHSLQAQERATNEQVAALQKNYLPNITGNGNYAWSGSNYPLQDSWNIGASVNFNLFNGGLTTAQVGEAKAILSNLTFNESVTRQNIALEVREAILNLRKAGQSIGVSATGVRQARENLELAEGRYETGVGNIIEVTDAQAALITAEAQYVQAIYNYRSSMASLEKAIARSITPGDPIAVQRAAKR